MEKNDNERKVVQLRRICNILGTMIGLPHWDPAMGKPMTLRLHYNGCRTSWTPLNLWSALICVKFYTIRLYWWKWSGSNMVYPFHGYILRTVQLMIYFKGWRLQWQQPIPSSALCGHVECGLGSHTGLKLWRLAHWCASLALKLTCFIIFSRATNSQHICLSVICVILFFWCYLGRERFPYLERKPMGIWQPKPMRKAWSFSASDPRSIFSSTSTSTWLLGILPFRHWATGHVWSYF